MLHIDIIAIGKLKEKYLVQGMEEYKKRLSSYVKLRIIEIPDEKAPETMSAAEEEQVKMEEGARLLDQLRAGTFLVALCASGSMHTSEQLAVQLGQLTTYGDSHVTFAIGGSRGLSAPVLKRASTQLSFGRMTYPHQLMRLILIEQIYRAFKIMRGETYHK